MVPGTRFQRAHQAQLETITAILLQYANTAEISRVVSVRRGNDAGEGYRHHLVIRQPPMPAIEFRNGCAVKERQAVKICQCIGDFVVMPVDLANPLHLPGLQNEASLCQLESMMMIRVSNIVPVFFLSR
jgi:hypothetical protein